MSSSSRTDTKRQIQARQRTWLREVCETTGLKPTQLAAEAKTNKSTITRFLNDENYTGTLAPETIELIKRTFKVPGPEEYANKGRSVFVGLSEAARFEPAREVDDLAAVVSAILRARPNVHAWRLKTMALEEVGYIPGDIVFVETLAEHAAPRPQDAVCAQVLDYQHGAAETVWRVYDPPYLVAAARERTAYKPMLVDGERVQVVGVIRESYRPHPLSSTR